MEKELEFVPKEIKTLITKEFAETFVEEISERFMDPIDEDLFTRIKEDAGAGGWYKALYKAIESHGGEIIRTYLEKLDWYDSDLFVADLGELIVEKYAF